MARQLSEQIEETPSHKFFQLNKIATALGIKKDKLYNNFSGKYNSLDTEGDNKRVAKFMIPHVKEFFARLGFNASFERTPTPKED